MDPAFIYKQGSLNKEHFIIALKFIGASLLATGGWPWLGRSQGCAVVGGGRIITYCYRGGKRGSGNSMHSW